MEPDTVDGASSAAPDRDTAAAWSDGASDLGVLLAGLMGGAGLIHLVMVPEHAGGGSWIDPVGFAVVGWLQIALAVVFLLRRGNRGLAVTAAVLNAAALGVWIWARTVGLPVGSHAGIVEEVGLVDGVCAGLEATAVVVAVVMAVAPRRLRVGLLLPSLAAVAVLGLVTVGLTSPDTAEHGAAGHSHGDEAAAAGHDHGAIAVDAAAHDDQMAVIDAERCDLGFNPKSYWSEAATLGVDTYGGGAMDMSVATSGDVTDVVGADDGRGSVGLDKLVAATSKADSGAEADAAGLVVALSQAEDGDYKAWRTWMAQRAASSGGGHAHGSSAAAAPDDNGGHGGHAGPTPWKAIVDQEQCVTLAQELEQARETALALPTAADAMAAGYVRVTRYVPGIAAHYMKFPYVDGEFHIDQPEMVLYDGDGPEARVVGLSYYLIQAGDAEPTQGFTGDNDHYHRHVGLCTGRGGVVGDSSTTEEECAQLGGVKANGSLGWMAHAWVVPGCESPWGVFSGASPMLDRALADASGTNEGACSASSGRDRYDLSPGEKAPDDSGERASGD
jgi:hypothetical protein